MREADGWCVVTGTGWARSQDFLRIVTVATQCRRVGVRRLPARVDPQFVGEQPPGAVEPVERLRAAPRTLKCPHERGGQRFVQRMGTGLRAQHGRSPGVLTQPAVGRGQ